MAKLKLPGCGPVDDLAEVIRYTEVNVVVLQSELEVIMLKPGDDVTKALTAREQYVMRASQLSGLRLAWLIVTGAEWLSEHPNLQLADSPVPES